MQIQMQAFVRKGRGGGSPQSLRTLVAQDLNRGKHEPLYVEEFKDLERSPGWAKIKARAIPGAINLEWDGSQRMLTARAIAKMGNRPHTLMAIFLAYLLDRHGRRLTSINLQLT
ncbi:MAG: hypothetical protein JSV19_10675 [Phycisphaerales bacterium]|nr:MAG: hypothetical protein JSV19_10675 [Phycisphaerales bacterium]